MATRESVDNCLLHCNEALEIANQQYSEAAKQEHYNDEDYIQSQQLLQLAANELQLMAHSCNDQQREQLNRMKIQIEQMQHDMITLRH
ncbi:DUF2524 family protein [Bacillus massiliigorillae]|uniref:DUF2524 family protein n=1 Tax=Bacillus massiliigorillae TaxID=1243664 RepID=UPI0003A60D25|nr:DUF2524 family protein [Bacillus massiliigorillae]